MARIALFTNEGMLDSATGTYTVGAATENEPGYTVHNEGWKTLDQAQQYAAENNASRGITKEDAMVIVASSMAAGTVDSAR